MVSPPRSDADSQQHAELLAQLEELSEQFEQVERRVHRVENTLEALARETSQISIGGPCTDCNQSRILIKDGILDCPTCSYRRSL